MESDEKDELERLSELYRNNVATELARLREAVEAAIQLGNFRNALAIRTLAESGFKNIDRKITLRIHSSSWNRRHPKVEEAQELD